jgi:hypothetical protein
MTTTDQPATALLNQLDALRAASAAPLSGFPVLAQDPDFPTDVNGLYPDGGSAAVAECYGADTAALVVAAVNAAPALTAALRAAQDGLRVIADRAAGANGCENYTGPWTCRDPHSGRSREGQYGAEQWCDACVAADALAAVTDALGATR